MGSPLIEKYLLEATQLTGSKSLVNFVRAIDTKYQLLWFHRRIAHALEELEAGRIKKLMVFMPPQHGKLLPADTPILTTKGWVSHGELSDGDFVFGQDGQPKRVLANSGIYDWNVEQIFFQDGKQILAAKEHLWKLEVEYDDHKGRRPALLSTENIFNKRHRRSPFIACAPAIDMPNADLPIDPYVLGCWLGDGHSNQGVLTAGVRDAGYFSALGDSREVKPGIYRILIPGLTKKLRELGVLKNKHIPIPYILASKQQREALLQGLMDTDGTVDKRGNCEFTQMDNQLVKDVYVLLRSLGYKARINYYEAKINGRIVGTKCRILFNPNQDDIVFSLPRKAERLKNKINADRDDKNKLFISKIEPFGTVKGNCIEVEGGMYLAGHDLIPTHNSQLTTRIFPCWAIGRNPNAKIAVASYSATVARRFNRDIKRIIKSDEYRAVFPDLPLPTRQGNHANTSDLIEIPDHKGSLYFVGRGGSLTSMAVEIGIIDDPLKDRKEAMSPQILEGLWNWYIDVFSTRILDTGRQVLIQTRWDQDDLAGRLLMQDGHYSESNPTGWVVISFPALRTNEPSEYDPRKEGEALWPERKGVATLEKIRAKNPVTFNSLYQQDPKPDDEVLVFPEWIPIDKFPDGVETVIYGLDFGFTNDPTGIVKVGIDGENMYVEELCYQTGMTNNAIADFIKAAGLENEIFVCDSSEPKSIIELQMLGINAMGAVKGSGSKNLGIDRLKGYTVHYVKTGVNLTREVKNYKWIVVAGKKTNTPQDGFDHLIDPTRYVIQTVIL